MIKRRFYKLEHGDRDGPSNSSSSSSDYELEAAATDETDEQDDEDEVVAEVRPKAESSSSGYESEDSSANEVDLDPSGLPAKDGDDDIETENSRQNNCDRFPSGICDKQTVERQCNVLAGTDGISSESAHYVLKCKSVFKCRLCPRIVCLTEETLWAHLKSKRHARSEKLLHEGRLKLMLNSDGDIHSDKHAPTIATAQNSSNSTKKKFRKRQGKRSKKNIGEDSSLPNARRSTKKRKKSEY